MTPSDDLDRADTVDVGYPPARRRGGRWDFCRRYARSPVALAGLGVIVALGAVALLAPWIAPHDPIAMVARPLVAFEWRHVFGTDNLGRDVLSGVIHGTRVSLAVGLIAAAASGLIGALVGSVAGFAGGTVDAILMRITELFQILPRFFLALLVIALAGPGIGKVVFVIAILSWPPMARLVRAEFLALREREFVEAARALGTPAWKIIFVEILPNALPPVIVAASLDVAQAILLEASLSFFGLGDPNMVTWGTMLNKAQPFLRLAWWMAVFPGLAIFVTVMSFNLVGTGLNDALNPRLLSR